MTKFRLKKVLVRWATDDATKTAQLETWLDETIEEMGTNKGAQIVNATTSGASFAVQANITLGDWVSILSDVLEHLENGTTPTNKTVGRLDIY